MKSLMFIVPVLLVSLGAAGAFLLIHSRSAPETRQPTVVVPLVRVIEARPEDRRLTVVSQGTVRKALNDMVAENLLVRRQGRGTFVSEHTERRALFLFFNLVGEDGSRTMPPRSEPDTCLHGMVRFNCLYCAGPGRYAKRVRA